jgi:RimJ/RimL family protein N-acetyltransferase
VALWRVHVELEDRPGRLGELATAVGATGCNIISVHVVGEPTDAGSITDELLVRVPDVIDPSVLIIAAARVGAPCTLHVPADAVELSDPVTTALALARMVAADPGSAPRAVATLLNARLVDPAAPPSAGLHTHSLRVGAQHLLLGRGWPFSATELSRASALLELAAQLTLSAPVRGPEPVMDRILLLRDGSEVLLRDAGPSDGPLVAALHARCSPESRRARFLSPTPRLDAAQLRALVGLDEGRAVLALTADGGSAVGLADLCRVPRHDGPQTDGAAASFGVLVDDAWQGRGLGTALLRRLVDTAGELGVGELTGTVPADGVRITRLLRRAGLQPSAVLADGALRLRVPLRAPAAMA